MILLDDSQYNHVINGVILFFPSVSTELIVYRK